jgi:hypothetical protein
VQLAEFSIDQMRELAWHKQRCIHPMNKGKPSGFEAETKKSAGAKSTSYERTGQAGAGPEWTERKRAEREREVVHAAGHGGPEQQAGGPDHHGGDAHEDRNP